jgi:hypothetical protein
MCEKLVSSDNEAKLSELRSSTELKDAEKAETSSESAEFPLKQIEVLKLQPRDTQILWRAQ